jgi:hypothetical protein
MISASLVRAALATLVAALARVVAAWAAVGDIASCDGGGHQETVLPGQVVFSSTVVRLALALRPYPVAAALSPGPGRLAGLVRVVLVWCPVAFRRESLAAGTGMGSLPYQAGIRGPGNCDAELRDVRALAEWLAERGLSRLRRVWLVLARARADDGRRRAARVAAAPPAPVYAAESIYAELAATPPTPAHLDGAAELFTCFEWAGSARAAIPGGLRSQLIAHVEATGTEPMKFRMRHGCGAERSVWDAGTR